MQRDDELKRQMMAQALMGSPVAETVNMIQGAQRPIIDQQSPVRDYGGPQDVSRPGGPDFSLMSSIMAKKMEERRKNRMDPQMAGAYMPQGAAPMPQGATPVQGLPWLNS